MSVDIELPTPTEFPAFPYNPPYEIQVALMRHLYASIEQRKGKTLSLLCASLTWLRDERDRAKKGKLRAVAGSDIDAKDWVIEQTVERVRRELEADEREYEAKLSDARKRENTLKKMCRARVVKKQKRDAQPVEDDNDDQFLPEDHSDGEHEEMNISPALRALMAKSGSTYGSGEETEPTCTKIYYASRTHSQLTQILPELQRLKLNLHVSSHHTSDTVSTSSAKKRTADELDADVEPGPSTRTVALGSRKQLCINDELRAKSRDLDEGCRELLGEKDEKRCQYLPAIGDEEKMFDFRDQILATPKDIEDLAIAGRRAQTCPYFASRRAIPQAQLITLPYNLLLQKTAREALGIDLTDHIVVIDEAHNLIPTLLSLSTSRLPQAILLTSFMQVCTYVAKFRNRLNPANLLHLKRLVVFLDALKKYVIEWKESRTGKSVSERKENSGVVDKVEVITPAQVMERLGRKASGINLLEIEKYLRTSKVARKISGYSDKEAEKNGDATRPRRGEIPPLNIVENFLVLLTGATDDGRVTFSLVGPPGNEQVELKFQQLNPSPPFKEVVDVARSVILAGGTMSPMSDVVNQLFSYLPPEKFSTFSCGHIIPAQNLQAVVVSKSPRGSDLEYKAGKQGDAEVYSAIGDDSVFPIVQLLEHSEDGLGQKRTFFEPTETTDVDKVLQDYSAAIHANSSATVKTRGALLFAVIGAKLSEGLNFADDLARAVVIVGLPFPNLGSLELKERMQYVKRLEESRGTKRAPGQKDAAAELYENLYLLTHDALSLGRAIRHRGDWASLILLDRRYASTSIRNKLPKWIGTSITVTEGFGQTVKSLGSFYRNKKQSFS
ncbi:hypothetical protein H0H92_006051 [Tricholoma furcatifolium]|nr:hypothetical protein H0H92_006051 [Tricholoma furcatifolium]